MKLTPIQGDSTSPEHSTGGAPSQGNRAADKRGSNPGGVHSFRERPILFNGEMVHALLEGRKTQTRRVIPESFNGCMTLGGPHPCPNRPEHFKAGETDPTRDEWHFFCSTLDAWVKCKYGQVGDRLWVKETFTYCRDEDEFDEDGKQRYYYRADGADVQKVDGDGFQAYRKDGREASPWISSLLMPRKASRLTLEIESIRVERVQEISEEDAIAEGTRERSEDESEQEFYRSLCPCCGGTGLYDAASLAGVSPDTDCTTCDTFKKRYRILWDSINAERGYGWDVNPWVWVVSFKPLTGAAK